MRFYRERGVSIEESICAFTLLVSQDELRLTSHESDSGRINSGSGCGNLIGKVQIVKYFTYFFCVILRCAYTNKLNYNEVPSSQSQLTISKENITTI